jgi:hypothetical protein
VRGLSERVHAKASGTDRTYTTYRTYMAQTHRSYWSYRSHPISKPSTVPDEIDLASAPPPLYRR